MSQKNQRIRKLDVNKIPVLLVALCPLEHWVKFLLDFQKYILCSFLLAFKTSLKTTVCI